MDNSEKMEKLIENNKRISELLKENEQLIIEEGFNPPENNYTLDKIKRINIPSAYIRKNEYFQKKYHLNEIVLSRNTVKNIAYSFQLSDYYNYLVNRINIWGSIETMFYKNAVINLVSIMEAIVFECVNNICRPSDCKLIVGCKIHFTKKQRHNFIESLRKLNQLGVSNFNDDEIARIEHVFKLRNRIHIRLATENEFISSDFSVSLYNETIVFIQRITEDIFTNGVILYGRCGNH